jgi:hypothetical protein
VGSIDWSVKITMSELIRVIVLLAALIASWYKLDARLTVEEQRQADEQQLLQRVNSSMEQVQRYLSSRDAEYWYKSMQK